MNPPNTDLMAARDDLRIIRDALERTAPSFRPLASSFFRAGLVWLILAFLLFSIEGTDLLSYLFPALYSFQPFGAARPLLYGIFRGCLLLGYLVLCLLWQREKTSKALSRLPCMVLSIWQAALLLILVFNILPMLAMHIHSNTVSVMGEANPFDLALMAQWASQWITPLLFPLLPLLFTSLLVEDAPLRWLSLVILALLLSYLALCLFANNATISPSLLWASVFLSLMKSFLPPIALLFTARRLRKLPEGA